MRVSAKDREMFIGEMMREGATYETCRRLLRCAKSIQRHAEAQCNRVTTEAEDRAYRRCVGRAYDSAATFGAKVRLGSDPRGYCLKLILPSGRFNTCGGAEEGYGVPA